MSSTSKLLIGKKLLNKEIIRNYLFLVSMDIDIKDKRRERNVFERILELRII